MLGFIRRSTRRQLLILVFNHFDGWHSPSNDGCERPFEITTDRARLGEADAVVFHIPTWTDACNVRKRRGQKFVALSSESEINYPHLKDKAFMARFDYTMLYRQDASVWCPYFGPDLVDALRTPPKPSATMHTLRGLLPATSIRVNERALRSNS